MCGKGDKTRPTNKGVYDKNYERIFGEREIPNLVPPEDRCSECEELICVCDED